MFSRKLRRNKKKEFAKSFKKAMKRFESFIRCSVCDRVPNALEGEKIDDWHMVKAGKQIKLTCPACKEVDHVDQ